LLLQIWPQVDEDGRAISEADPAGQWQIAKDLTQPRKRGSEVRLSIIILKRKKDLQLE